MRSDIDWSVPRRQSKAMILLSFVRMLKTLWPLLLLLIARHFFTGDSAGGAGFSNLLWWLMGALVVFILIRLNDIAQYFFYRFCIVDQQLIIFSGVIVKKKTEVPLARIQAIHSKQTFLHKLSHTCKLVIDTAGSEKAELTIDALNIHEATEFQHLLLTKKTGIEIEKAPDEAAGNNDAPQILQLGFKDILRLCVSENHLKTFFVVIGFLVGKMQDIRDYLGFDSFMWMQQYSSSVSSTVQSILIVLILGLLFSILVSCVRVFLRFYGFRVQLRQQDFLMQWGLFETQQKHISFNKVQLLSWRSTFIRRLMGMTILRLHATAEDEGKEDQLIQVPITRMNQLSLIAGYYQGKFPAMHSPANGIQKNYVTRQVLLAGIPVVLILTGGLYFWVGWHALWSLLWLAYFSVSAYLYYRNFKIWLNDDALQIEKGVWGSENILINFGNIQQVAIKTSPYKRKNQLADLLIYTTGVTIKFPFLKQDDAAFIADFLLVNMEFEKELANVRLPIHADKSAPEP